MSQVTLHPDLAKTLSEAKLPETRVEYLKQPLQTNLGNFKLILDAPAWKKEMPDNDGSLFAWIGNGKSSVVFTGDAGIEAEASMIRRRSWAAQVAHIGHHGSYTSTSNAWLEHVKPSIALVSCGRDNSYGHPHQPVIDRLRDHKVETLRTDRDGTIRMRATDSGFIRVSP